MDVTPCRAGFFHVVDEGQRSIRDEGDTGQRGSRARRCAPGVDLGAGELVQSIRDCCPAPMPNAMPSRRYATEFDWVWRMTMRPSNRSRAAAPAAGRRRGSRGAARGQRYAVARLGKAHAADLANFHVRWHESRVGLQHEIGSALLVRERPRLRTRIPGQ